ncbi:MAG: metallophosphoesterase family protein [Candidatus Aenigmatarchaeota archaeon]
MPYNHARAWLEAKAESAAPKPIPPNKIAIISDIHSNLDALDAVLKEIKESKCQLILCTGDIIGYATECNECCEIVKKNAHVIVQGNHDANVDFRRIEWFNPEAAAALRWTEAKLTRPNKAWLLGLPVEWYGQILGRKIYMVHGSPYDQLYGYVMPNTDRHTFRKWLNEKRAHIIIMGHTHIPFVEKMEQGLIINAGSVGQPRDGNPKACWIELILDKLEAKIHRVSYNIEMTAEKILEQNLPAWLAERLYDGL